MKPTVEPRLTLMSVAKPWMEALPEPVMSHSLLGLPGLVFSQAISLTTGASQAAAAAGTGTAATNATPKLNASRMARRRRPRLSGWSKFPKSARHYLLVRPDFRTDADMFPRPACSEPHADSLAVVHTEPPCVE